MTAQYFALPHVSDEPDGDWCVVAHGGATHLRDIQFTKPQAEAVAAQLNDAFAAGERKRARKIAELLDLDE